MQEKPLDMLRRAHQNALGELDWLEKSARELTAGAADGGSAFGKVFPFFDNELKVHFRHEEEILFPYLARVIGREGPIVAMLDEHQTLWRTWDAFQEKLNELRSSGTDATGKQVQTVREIANHIVGFLRSHIQKEDGVLLPLAEEALDPTSMKEVVAMIRAVETPA